jgi:hypothetical protein
MGQLSPKLRLAQFTSETTFGRELKSLKEGQIECRSSKN